MIIKVLVTDLESQFRTLNILSRGVNAQGCSLLTFLNSKAFSGCSLLTRETEMHYPTLNKKKQERKSINLCGKRYRFD